MVFIVLDLVKLFLKVLPVIAFLVPLLGVLILIQVLKATRYSAEPAEDGIDRFGFCPAGALGFTCDCFRCPFVWSLNFNSSVTSHHWNPSLQRMAFIVLGSVQLELKA